MQWMTRPHCAAKFQISQITWLRGLLLAKPCQIGQLLAWQGNKTSCLSHQPVTGYPETGTALVFLAGCYIAPVSYVSFGRWKPDGPSEEGSALTCIHVFSSIPARQQITLVLPPSTPFSQRSHLSLSH